MRIILASKSPRRRQILADLGVRFEVLVVDSEEKSEQINPSEFVCDIAGQKGKCVVEKLKDDDALIISADTIVVLDNEILGKPKSNEHAKEMIRKLQGREHEVITAVSLSYNGKTLTDCERSSVFFAPMTESEIEFYISLNESLDKAGAYAVQGKGALFIEKIDGSYFNVVGFPTRLFYKMITKLGLTFGDLS